MKVYFLGPVGTFTHDAASMYFSNRADILLLPCSTPSEVLRKVQGDQGSHGVVPIENSVQGEVIPTLDALCFEFADVYVVGEVSLPVSFDWFGLAETSKPSTAISHPHGLAQCKRFIGSGGLQEQSASSTAEACRIVAERRDELLGAIASSGAGERFGLIALRRAVEDFPGAYTRFLVVGGALAPTSLADRTMLALVPPSNSRGILAQFSRVLAAYDVNILNVHNRPLKTGPGNYLFVLTIEGTIVSGPPREALNELMGLGYGVKLLGVYPGWGGPSPAAPWPHLPGLLSLDRLQAVLKATNDSDGTGA